MTECRIKGIIERCACIPFYYPHVCMSILIILKNFKREINFISKIFKALPQYENIPQCRLPNVKCLHRIRTNISSIRPPHDAAGFEHFGDEHLIGLNCDCAPDCSGTVNNSFLFSSLF